MVKLKCCGRWRVGTCCSLYGIEKELLKRDIVIVIEKEPLNSFTAMRSPDDE